LEKKPAKSLEKLPQVQMKRKIGNVLTPKVTLLVVFAAVLHLFALLSPQNPLITGASPNYFTFCIGK